MHAFSLVQISREGLPFCRKPTGRFAKKGEEQPVRGTYHPAVSHVQCSLSTNYA